MWTRGLSRSPTPPSPPSQHHAAPRAFARAGRGGAPGRAGLWAPLTTFGERRPPERLEVAPSCLFRGENHPLFLPRPFSRPLKPLPLPSPPAPFLSAVPALPPPGFPVRLFLPRVSLPLRFPPAGVGLGLLPGPGGGQRPPLQPGRAAARGPTRGGRPRAPRGSNNNNNQQNPQTNNNNNKKEAKNWKPLLSW